MRHKTRLIISKRHFLEKSQGSPLSSVRNSKDQRHPTGEGSFLEACPSEGSENGPGGVEQQETGGRRERTRSGQGRLLTESSSEGETWEPPLGRGSRKNGLIIC